MPTNERASDRGRHQAGRLVADIGGELREARLAAGVSQGSIGRAAGISHAAVSRIERGAAPYVSIRRLAIVASVLGLRLSVRVYPVGLPLRDAAQLALLERLRQLLHPSLAWRTEVPLPIDGDLRAWDASISGRDWTAHVDAETRIRDAQSLTRRVALKQRDTPTDRVILLIADSRTNRSILRSLGAPLVADAMSGSRLLGALRAGQDPGGSGVVLL
jgi:transcriptional regulator with XRE-family HTH domain